MAPRSVNMCWSTVVELPQPKTAMWSELELRNETVKVRTVRKSNWNLKSMSAGFCSYSTGFVFRSAESGKRSHPSDYRCLRGWQLRSLQIGQECGQEAHCGEK
jgi:hypothetical protein